MAHRYTDSQNTTEEEAKKFEAQREKLASIVNGEKGEDFATLIGKVSEAVKAVRQDVAANLYHAGNGTVMEAAGSIDNIIKAATKKDSYTENKRVHRGPGYIDHISNIPGLSAINESYTGKALFPEQQLDTLGDVLRAVVEDRRPLTEDEQEQIRGLAYTLSSAQQLLEASVKASEERGSIITVQTATRAKTAIRILQNELSQAINTQNHAELESFASQPAYTDRHANQAYGEILNALSPEQPKAEVPKRRNMPKWMKTAGLMAGSFAAGAGTNEYMHSTKPDTAIRRNAADEIKNIISEGPQSSVDRGDGNSKSDGQTP